MGTIWTLSAKSYRDAIGLLQRAGGTVAIAVLLLAASSLISLGADRLITTMLGRQVAGTLLSVAGIWFAAPYLVSLYRLLLNDETVRPETLRNTDASRKFFAWSAVLAFVAAAPGYFFAAVMPPGFSAATAENPEYAYLVWTTFFLLVAVWIFTTRTITLLPAAALGEEIGLRDALQHTRRRFWFVVGAVTVPLLPVTLVGLLLTASTGGIVSIVFSIAMALGVLILAVAVTANLYRWLMDNPK
jgi:membrane protease YdiL (CAAX protease family)